MKARELLAELNEGCEPGQMLLTYRQLDWWDAKGLLSPESGGRGTGSGRARSFSDKEAEVARLMAHLVRSGFEPKAASVIAQESVLSHATRWNLSGPFLLLNVPV